MHVNRLKEAHNPEAWKPRPERKFPWKQTRETVTQADEEEEGGVKIGSIPLLKSRRPEARDEHRTPPDPVLDTPDPMQQSLDTPSSEHRDPSYEPPESPRSNPELSITRPEPPVTRSLERIQTQDDRIAEI